MSLHIQYLTDAKGIPKAVQIPYKEWKTFFADYKRLSQLGALDKSLKSALKEVEGLESGKKRKTTLMEFLDEC